MTRLFLYAQAGGRCEFDGCNEYLLEHYPTEAVGNFAEQAHIYAFNADGPRGREPGRPKDINRLSNLILLCGACHHLIDTKPQKYPVEVLRKFKREHEDRVHDLTGLAKDRDTVPLVFKALVAGRAVDISDEEMQAAVAPDYLKCRQKIEIDLTAIPDAGTAAYWTVASSTIDQEVKRLYSLPTRPGRTLRVSVFAVAPIPLLIHLGARLSDKMHLQLFQRHRSPESWQWNSGPGVASYATRCIQKGTDPASVAYLLNLSGTTSIEELTGIVDGRFSVYETTLADATPTPLFLKCRADLEKLHDEYVRTMAMIRKNHPKLETIHLFPATPSPVAILIGRSRLPKVDPTLRIYDRDKRAGGFVSTIEVGSE